MALRADAAELGEAGHATLRLLPADVTEHVRMNVQADIRHVV